jgi:hypothetical protein
LSSSFSCIVLPCYHDNLLNKRSNGRSLPPVCGETVSAGPLLSPLLHADCLLSSDRAALKSIVGCFRICYWASSHRMPAMRQSQPCPWQVHERSADTNEGGDREESIRIQQPGTNSATKRVRCPSQTLILLGWHRNWCSGASEVLGAEMSGKHCVSN